jgi:hypothetical protein
MAAPKANKNAQKDETASSFLHIRVTQREKSAWVKAAIRSGKKPSAWVSDVLNAAAK